MFQPSHMTTIDHTLITTTLDTIRVAPISDGVATVGTNITVMTTGTIINQIIITKVIATVISEVTNAVITVDTKENTIDIIAIGTTFIDKRIVCKKNRVCGYCPQTLLFSTP